MKGDGVWDGSFTTNPQNAPRRDLQDAAAWGGGGMWLGNTMPIVWLFHCHVAWRLSLVCGPTQQLLASEHLSVSETWSSVEGC